MKADRPLFDRLLEAVRKDPANHNRWKMLAHYESSGTAKVTATRLRKRHPDCVFKVAPHGDRWAVGVLYKHTDLNGRLPGPQPATEDVS